MVKCPTGAEISMMASIVSAVIWPLVTKLVAVRLVTVGSIEAAPYPLVGPLENIAITRAEKKSPLVLCPTENTSLRDLDVCEVAGNTNEPFGALL